MMKEYSREIEWPTVVLIAADYGVLALIVWYHASLPWWVILPIGAYCAALHAEREREREREMKMSFIATAINKICNFRSLST